MAMFDKQHSSRLGRQHVTTISSVSAQTTAFGSQTYQIRVVPTLSIYGITGTSTYTATGVESFFPANVIDYLTVTGGQVFTYISTSTSSGVVSITEMG